MDKLHEQLKYEEGLRLTVYHCTAGKRTIGYGHNLDANPFFPGTKSRIPDKITQAQAMELLDNDISNVIHDVQHCWPFVKTLSIPRQDACYNMAFQLGVNGLLGFGDMIKAIETGDFGKAYKEALNSKWARKDTPERANRVASQILLNKHYEIPKS